MGVHIMKLGRRVLKVEQTMRLTLRPVALSLQEAMQSPRLIRKNFEVPLALQNGESMLIGRDESIVTLTIHDDFISRVHAALVYENGAYFLRDMRSKNGTYLNNQRIDANTNVGPLSDGDCIKFGPVDFYYYKSEQHLEASIN